MCWQLSIMSTLSKLVTLRCRGFWRKQRVKCMMWIRTERTLVHSGRIRLVEKIIRIPVYRQSYYTSVDNLCRIRYNMLQACVCCWTYLYHVGGSNSVWSFILSRFQIPKRSWICSRVDFMACLMIAARWLDATLSRLSGQRRDAATLPRRLPTIP